MPFRPRCASGSTSCSGRSFKPRPFPATIAGIDPSSISAAEMATRVRTLLERCPSWLDLSPLTFELAEEIRLREGSPSPDPARDAGVYRFLFERRLDRPARALPANAALDGLVLEKLGTD